MGGATVLALEVLKNLPGFISAGVDVANLIGTTISTIKSAQAQHRDPTDAEWDTIHHQIDALRSALDAPE
jgi:hypothetical protein